MQLEIVCIHGDCAKPLFHYLVNVISSNLCKDNCLDILSYSIKLEKL